MSISLPNGTLLAAPSQSHAQLTAAVTRILHLGSFSPELKTRDLQLIFKDYETERGGFKIKWIDDQNALAVFADPGVAKKAYLSLLLNPPAVFPPPATIRPYDRPDAAQIIQSLAARSHGHRAGASASFSEHGRAQSMSSGTSGFVMPLQQPGSVPAKINGLGHHRSGSSSQSISINGLSNGAPLQGQGHQRVGSFNSHHRSLSSGGIGGTSGSWSRQAMPGVMGSFNSSSNSGRLPTHTESGLTPTLPSAGSPPQKMSALQDSILNHSAGGGSKRFNSGFGSISKALGATAQTSTATAAADATLAGGSLAKRRDSTSAEKAMKEVEKAMGIHVDS